MHQSPVPVNPVRGFFVADGRWPEVAAGAIGPWDRARMSRIQSAPVLAPTASPTRPRRAPSLDIVDVLRAAIAAARLRRAGWSPARTALRLGTNVASLAVCEALYRLWRDSTEPHEAARLMRALFIDTPDRTELRAQLMARLARFSDAPELERSDTVLESLPVQAALDRLDRPD